MAPPSSLRSVRSVRARAKSDAMSPPSSMPLLSTPAYSHVSSYRSLQMELLLYSPYVKVVPSPWSANHTLPVFGDHDIVGGKVILDPSCQSGRLVLTIEGAFTYSPTEKDGDNIMADALKSGDTVFVGFEYSAVGLEGFVFVIKRRPSGSNIKSMVLEPRAYPFSWEIPRSQRSNEEVPPTFCSSDPQCAPFEVIYQVSAVWESSDITENPSFLEVPIVLHPDPDFHSLDGLPDENSSSWLEMPLKSDRPMSFRCAPSDHHGARRPAYHSSADTKRRVSDSLPFQQPRTKLLRRVRSRTSPWSPRALDDPELREKPLPRLPTQTAFSATQTVHSSMCIGFPKRPRHQQSSSKVHPSLHAHQALPDGLHKAKIPLNRDMLPSIDWAGVSVKYYMDISVLFGQDELRARVPLRII
ncbi:hypothetical protein B0H14DRAFT_2560105 [Mycena olivaceomarginata]|nr:hypothetical protein B0H14DRAFT_2560105 [Mycena olivaceomarginata]